MERSEPQAVRHSSNNMGGRGGMIKTPINLQDLRRKILHQGEGRHGLSAFGDCTSMSARWKRSRKPTRWPRRTTGFLSGIDGVTFEAIEDSGVESFLYSSRTNWRHTRYRPLRESAARDTQGRRKGPRPGQVPCIRDRVVQGALKLILEPIFEADFQPGSFGYRPQRTAHQAVQRGR